MKNSTNQIARLRAAALLALVLPFTAMAEIKNFTFQGTINVVEDMGFLLDGSITNGSPFEGFFIFETTATDANGDPTVGDYRYINSAMGVVVKIGSYVFRTNPRHVDFLIELVNRPADDHYLIRSYNNVCSAPLAVEHISWQLDDFSGGALGNVSLLTTPPNLSAYQSSFGLTVDGGCDLFLLRGTVTSITEAPAVIPESPVMDMAHAVEINWPSRLGYFYQIQSTSDHKSWNNVGEPVLGDGSTLSRFFPRGQGKPVFYRVEIANYHK